MTNLMLQSTKAAMEDAKMFKMTRKDAKMFKMARKDAKMFKITKENNKMLKVAREVAEMILKMVKIDVKTIKETKKKTRGKKLVLDPASPPSRKYTALPSPPTSGHLRQLETTSPGNYLLFGTASQPT